MASAWITSQALNYFRKFDDHYIIDKLAQGLSTKLAHRHVWELWREGESTFFIASVARVWPYGGEFVFAGQRWLYRLGISNTGETWHIF